ncbi:MAG: CBS domain-containing protein [Phycisphaeraceae bacterium]|nr:CBS domain-containing protein [Phycisphaeraceae bacterium]
MTHLRDVIEHKGDDVLTAGPEEPVIHAAVRMNEHRVGCLLVVNEGQPVGMISERDVLRRVVAERRDPAETKVDEVMTRELVCARSQTSLEEARSVMKHRRIRHLPVVDEDGKLKGLVSIGDLNAWQLNGQEETIHLLNEYIHGYR